MTAMFAVVFASVGSYLSGLLTRISEGHFMSYTEMCDTFSYFVIWGFRFDMTFIEALLFWMGYVASCMWLAYLWGHEVGYKKGHKECDIEWWESIDEHYDRLKKYGFGDNEANDRAAVKTYKEMKDKREREKYA